MRVNADSRKRIWPLLSFAGILCFSSFCFSKGHRQEKTAFPTFSSTLEGLKNEKSTSPLAIQEVLDSALSRFPLLEIARENLKVVEGEVLSNSGIFDPRLSLLPNTNPAGKEQYQYLRSSVDVQTSFWGTQFYLGHQISSGDVPIYKGE
ncbi:MAG: hypothetical protein K2X47_06275, partial [Bdellovibrionales bacterium]|nr:hypothetical protein [Bdellovibrionales bacterium]